MKLTIGCLYPDLFNLYGDRGNVQCLKKRLQWRGIEAEVVSFLAGDRVDFGKLDILAWGAAPTEDRPSPWDIWGRFGRISGATWKTEAWCLRCALPISFWGGITGPRGRC